MKIRKSFAGVAAGSLVLAGVAIATAPAAQAATGGPYTLSGAPLNQAGGASYGGTPTVTLTAVQNGLDLDISANISVGPTTTSFAGFNAGEYRLDAYVRIDGGPQVQLTGPVGAVAVPPSSVSYPSGAIATATVSGLSVGPHSIVLQSLAVDSSGTSSGSGFASSWSQLAGFDALYNLSTTVPGVVSDPPATPIGLTENITTVGPEVQITGSSNQMAGVTGYVRGSATATASVTGTLFSNNVAVGGITAAFCDGTGANCDANATNTLSTNGTGNLSGTVSVAAATTTGLRTLKVTEGTNVALYPVTVLAAPSITITPANGGPGTVVNWTGSSFNPGGFGVAHASIANPNGFCNVPDGPTPGAPCNDPVGNFAVGPYVPGGSNVVVGWTATGTGSASGSVTVTDPATIQIQVSQKNIVGGAPVNTNLDMTSLGQGTSKALAFTVNADQCTRQTGTGPVTLCETKQNITASVTPGSLTQQAFSAGLPGYSSTAIPMGSLTTSIAPQVLTGQINPITVTDARGGSATWSLTATMPDLVGSGTAAGADIEAVNLTLGGVSCAEQIGSATGITSGTGGTFGGAALTICDASSNNADSNGDTVGGQWIANAPLTLNVPAFQQAGDYSSTITFTLT